MKKVNITYKNLEELKDVFVEIGDDKVSSAIALIDEAIYCGNVLQTLKEDVKKNGTLVEMPQGAYSITRINPALTMYNTTLKSYSSLIKQITGLLPTNTNIEIDDGFDDFVKG